MDTHTPDPVDVFAGTKLRERRKILGLSQQALADTIGVTFQQVQKYERGANRVSVSTLHRLASALNVPPGYFFPAPDADLAPQPVDPIIERAQQKYDMARRSNRGRPPWEALADGDAFDQAMRSMAIGMAKLELSKDEATA